MGTRSDIIVHCADGKWRRIYCHWDGYLSHNGRILFDHYTDQKKNEKLVGLGDISSLQANIGRKHPFDAPSYGSKKWEEYQKKYGDMCLAYGRDRGEEGTEAHVFDTLFDTWPDNQTGTEFTYVWCSNPRAAVGERPDPANAKWWVGDPDKGTQTLIDLGDALTGKKVITPAVKAFGGNFVVGQHLPHDPNNN